MTSNEPASTSTTHASQILNRVWIPRPAGALNSAKKPNNRSCTTIEQQFNRAHNAVRATGELGNSLLKTTFKALRNVSLCPWTITRITAAALVILHIEHGRTT
jgi:hypothetical protein